MSHHSEGFDVDNTFKDRVSMLLSCSIISYKWGTFSLLDLPSQIHLRCWFLCLRIPILKRCYKRQAWEISCEVSGRSPCSTELDGYDAVPGLKNEKGEAKFWIPVVQEDWLIYQFLMVFHNDPLAPFRITRILYYLTQSNFDNPLCPPGSKIIFHGYSLL